MVAIMLVFVAVVLHVKYEPYDDDDLDSLEMWSLVGSYFTLFLGLFFAVDGLSKNVLRGIGFSILFVNFITMSNFALNVMLLGRDLVETKVDARNSKKLLKKQIKEGILPEHATEPMESRLAKRIDTSITGGGPMAGPPISQPLMYPVPPPQSSGPPVMASGPVVTSGPPMVMTQAVQPAAGPPMVMAVPAITSGPPASTPTAASPQTKGDK